MRHAIGALCACFVFVFPAVSPAADTIAFAGVEWRSTVASVKSVMAERGFTLENVDQDGDLQFTGTAFGDKSTVFALFNARGELVKWSVVLRIPDHRAVHRYRELKAQLTAQSGDPFGEIEEWEYPYDDGGQVGHEETAIRLGKGELKAGWQTVGTQLPVRRHRGDGQVDRSGIVRRTRLGG